MSELARAYRFAVNVTPKPGILDPQGKAVERSLPHLGIAGVTGVRVGRRVEMSVAAADEAAARAIVDRLAGDLLSNPLMEQFEVEAAGRGRGPGRGRAGRMTVRVGIVLFPGSNRDIDAVNALRVAGAEPEILWHESVDLAGVAGILIPGGFAYGDYLRAGVIARFSPVMRAVADFAERGGPVLGICNGFQVLAEARLVPGRPAAQPRPALRVQAGDAAPGAPRLAVHARDRGAPPAPDAGRPRRGLLLRGRGDAGRAGARRRRPVALRQRGRLRRRPRRPRQPQRVPARDRGRAQRRGQRGRADAPPRDGRRGDPGQRRRPRDHPLAGGERGGVAADGPDRGHATGAGTRPPSRADRRSREAPHDRGARPAPPRAGAHRRRARGDPREAGPRGERPRAGDVQRHVERALLVQELPPAAADAARPRARTSSPASASRRA